MPILRKIQTFRSLPGREAWAFVEASLLLAYARVLVTFVPLKRWRHQVELAKPDAAITHELTKTQRQTARMIERTLRRTGRNLPLEFVCLPQALAARWMLSRRGTPTELFFGTRLATEEDREFHAWLKAGDIMITGHCDESEYAIFGSQKRV